MHRLFIFLTLLIYSTCLLADNLVKPNPKISPIEVVEVQLFALQSNDDKSDLLTSITGNIDRNITYDVYSDVIGDGINAYKYNDDGNMISATSPKGTKSFVYEANNIRTETTNIDGSIT